MSNLLSLSGVLKLFDFHAKGQLYPSLASNGEI